MWFMLLAIPDHASNVDGAHQFIDYVMTPEVSAQIADFSHEPNANLGRLAFRNPRRA